MTKMTREMRMRATHLVREERVAPALEELLAGGPGGDGPAEDIPRPESRGDGKGGAEPGVACVNSRYSLLQDLICSDFGPRLVERCASRMPVFAPLSRQGRGSRETGSLPMGCWNLRHAGACPANCKSIFLFAMSCI